MRRGRGEGIHVRHSFGSRKTTLGALYVLIRLGLYGGIRANLPGTAGHQQQRADETRCSLCLERIAAMYAVTSGCRAASERAIAFYISPPGSVINTVLCISHSVPAPRDSPSPRMINTPETEVFAEQEIGT